MIDARRRAPAWITYPLGGICLGAVTVTVNQFVGWLLPIMWSMP